MIPVSRGCLPRLQPPPAPEAIPTLKASEAGAISHNGLLTLVCCILVRFLGVLVRRCMASFQF